MNTKHLIFIPELQCQHQHCSRSVITSRINRCGSIFLGDQTFSDFKRGCKKLVCEEHSRTGVYQKQINFETHRIYFKCLDHELKEKLKSYG